MKLLSCFAIEVIGGKEGCVKTMLAARAVMETEGVKKL